jgi:hypothetical protein
MAAQGGSGFDAARFRKLVAMFDSPYSEEAATAFKLALAELKKKQQRFCDQLVDSTEAEHAKAECARVRSELGRVLDRCEKSEAEASDLEEIINGLHKRIASMERSAAANTGTARRTPPVETFTPYPIQPPDTPRPHVKPVFVSNKWEEPPAEKNVSFGGVGRALVGGLRMGVGVLIVVLSIILVGGLLVVLLSSFQR